MTDHPAQNNTHHGVPAPPPDDENPALLDAAKTFKVSVISAIVFCLAALGIILATRAG